MATPTIASPNLPLAQQKSVARWLFACCAWLFVLVIVGGVTRLTHSGLSITEWQPLVGTIPPLSHADWVELFGKYQQTPEYRLVNSSMDLLGFQKIFWWEWVHRFLARGLGTIYAVPLFYFLARGYLQKPWHRRLLVLLVLGGAQGLWGWLMVKSGLQEQPWVSPVRLAGHLGLAFALYLAMFLYALRFYRGEANLAPVSKNSLSKTCFAALVLVFLQCLSGALVAGLRAGLIYNTFPKMNGAWVPADLLLLQPWWINFIEHGSAVQFVHRVIAGIASVVVLALAWRILASRVAKRTRVSAYLLIAAITVQVSLGIATLLMAVPVHLAATHQSGALILLSALAWSYHTMRTESA